MKTVPDVYKETEAMKAVMRALEALPPAGRERVLEVVDGWLGDMEKEIEE